MLIKNILGTPVVIISPDENVASACRVMKEANVGYVIIESENTLRGVLTDRNVAMNIVGVEKNPRETTVKETMSTDPLEISVSIGIYAKDRNGMRSLLHGYYVRRIPIIDHQLKGRGTLSDIIAPLERQLANIGMPVSGSRRKIGKRPKALRRANAENRLENLEGFDKRTQQDLD